MRTSTVLFVVLFLCLFSSTERRSRIRGFLEGVGAEIHELGHGRACSGAGCEPVRASETAEVRALRARLDEIEQRDEAAKRTLRTIDRSVRTLDDRIGKLEREMSRQPQFEDLYSGSLELLLRQRIELNNEREEIVGLQERMRGETIRLQAEIDLARIRSERREVESFLRSERASPLDQLTVEIR